MSEYVWLIGVFLGGGLVLTFLFFYKKYNGLKTGFFCLLFLCGIAWIFAPQCLCSIDSEKLLGSFFAASIFCFFSMFLFLLFKNKVKN